jgi:hypothetical protein
LATTTPRVPGDVDGDGVDVGPAAATVATRNKDPSNPPPNAAITFFIDLPPVLPLRACCVPAGNVAGFR